MLPRIQSPCFTFLAHNVTASQHGRGAEGRDPCVDALLTPQRASPSQQQQQQPLHDMGPPPLLHPGKGSGYYDNRRRRPLCLTTLTAAAALGLAALHKAAAAGPIPLPFPLPEQVLIRDASTSAPLVIWPRAFRMLDASREPTRTVAMALKRYWVRTSRPSS